MKGLQGRVAIVTGGASGIGRGIASVLASEGAHVVVADIDTRRAAEAASELASTEGGATSIEVDVRDRESVKAMADATLKDKERIDILCSNAGIYSSETLKEMTANEGGNIMYI